MSQVAHAFCEGDENQRSVSRMGGLAAQPVEPCAEPLPHLVPIRPRQPATIANYAVHRVVPRHAHSLYQSTPSATAVEDGYSASRTRAACASSESSAQGNRQPPPPSVPSTIRDGTWRALLERDECVAREALELEEIITALGSIPFPPPWSLVCGRASPSSALMHPAQVRGAVLIAQLEAFARHTIEDDYTDLFRQRSFRDAQLRARLVSSNFEAAKVHLRHWVARTRARKVTFGLRVERLVRQEAQQRAEWISTSDIMQERGALLSAILMALETRYRWEMERLYLCTAHATAVVGVRLGEKADALRVLFGGPMRAAKTCGRLSGLTVFSTLAREEEHHRRLIGAAQSAEAEALPLIMKAMILEKFEEPKGRAAIEQGHRESVLACFTRVTVLEAVYTLRDVEQYEAIARQRIRAQMPSPSASAPSHGVVSPHSVGPAPPEEPSQPQVMVPDEESEESSNADVSDDADEL